VAHAGPRPHHAVSRAATTAATDGTHRRRGDGNAGLSSMLVTLRSITRKHREPPLRPFSSAPPAGGMRIVAVWLKSGPSRAWRGGLGGVCGLDAAGVVLTHADPRLPPVVRGLLKFLDFRLPAGEFEVFRQSGRQRVAEERGRSEWQMMAVGSAVAPRVSVGGHRLAIRGCRFGSEFEFTVSGVVFDG
jgi:hypothetical protein